ncbi:MAG: hypothetical protein JOZ69_19490 [Myxococcales bacterium]|nr:hypothetical protein [Myxococcales bacterium]
MIDDSLTCFDDDRGGRTCAGQNRKPFREMCTDNHADDAIRVQLVCQHKFVRSWHRVPVIGKVEAMCTADEGRPDASADQPDPAGRADQIFVCAKSNACDFPCSQ